MRLWYDKQSVNPDRMAIYRFCSEELENWLRHTSGGVEVSARLLSKLENVAGSLPILAELIGLFSLNSCHSRSSEKWKRNAN